MWWLWFACSMDPQVVEAEPPAPVESKEKLVGAHHPAANAEKPDWGRWNLARTAAPADEIEALQAIGYLGGVEEGRGLTGVTRNTSAAYPGLNLYVSGDAPRAVLIDMDGAEVHSWNMPFKQAFPKRKIPRGARGTQFWRRVALLPNGDLLAIYEGQGLVRLNKDSELLWAWNGLAHHDIQVLPDGRIWVLSRKIHINANINPKKAILEDYATLLSAAGQRLRSISMVAAVRSGAPELLTRLPKKHGDIFHTNSLQVLAADQPFYPGKLLLSSRALSAIFVVDPDTGSVVWSHTGAYSKQHDPKILPNGHLLLFDNLGPKGQQSAVREYEPPEMKPLWSYTGSKERPFFTRFCGAAERLPNGNTLVVESGYGRAFELGADDEIVWEFYNPRRTGDADAYVAIVPDLIRISRESLSFLPPPSE